MGNYDDKTLRLIEVAKMYYLNNMTQSEIAKQFSISRPLVSKLLTTAKEQGIVSIKINYPLKYNEELLDSLKKKYKLKGGIIVPQAMSSQITDKLIVENLIYFMSNDLSETSFWGIGWGHMAGLLAKELEKKSTKVLNLKGKIVPLIGNTNMPSRDYHPNDLVRIFGEKLSLTPNFLFAPAFLTTGAEQKIFYNLENYKEINSIWNKLDVAIIGINSHPSVPDLATALRFGDELSEKKAVGKILSYYFDVEGNIIKGENDFSIQIPIKTLKKSKFVIGIASSKINKNAIIGALKTKLFTHILISDTLAEEVVR